MENHLSEVLRDGALNIGASAVWDLAKFFGSQVLSRMRDPWVRQRVMQEAEQELVRRGMSTEQAGHLMWVLREKRTLTRWGVVDPEALERHIQSDVQEAGYLPVESTLLFHALLRAYVTYTSKEPLTALMTADGWLRGRAPRHISESLLLYAEACRNPERLGAALLSQILVEANQSQAKLVVDATGKITVEDVRFHVSAFGEDGMRLYEAVENARAGKLDAGEFTIVKASYPGAITFTTGHVVLDRLLHLNGPPDALSVGQTL